MPNPTGVASYLRKGYKKDIFSKLLTGLELVLVPVSCCGARQKLRLTKQARFSPTAATRSPRSSRPRRRSGRSPDSHLRFSFYPVTGTKKADTRFGYLLFWVLCQ